MMSQSDGQTDRQTVRHTLRVSSAPLLARLWPLLANARLVISVEGWWALRMTRPPPDTYRQSCLAIICGLGGITTPVDAAVPNFPVKQQTRVEQCLCHIPEHVPLISASCLSFCVLWCQNCAIVAMSKVGVLHWSNHTRQ